MSQQSPDPERQKQAREYARINRRLFFLELALGVILLLVFLLSDLSAGLRDLLDFPRPARVFLYFTVLMVGYGALLFPLSFYQGYVLPHRYGLSRQDLRAWLWDGCKSGLLGLALGGGLLVAIYELLAAFPGVWWLFGFALVTFVTVILSNLAPLIIVPLFYKMQPLPDHDLKQRLLDLAQRCQVRIKNVYLMNLGSKTSAGNAMVMGWGNTKRIVIGDTLLARYTPEEIETVMAHELGHYRNGDIAKLMIMQSASFLAAFYLSHLTLDWAVPRLGYSAISDVAAFPLLALVIGAFVVAIMPMTNAYTRRLESAADGYALRVTNNPASFTSMLTKLTDQNLGEEEPSRWVELLFYTHPPYSQRVKQAMEYRKEEA